MLFRIHIATTEYMTKDVDGIFAELKIGIDIFQVSMAGDKNLIQFDAEVTARRQENILGAICKPGVTREMVLVERQNR